MVGWLVGWLLAFLVGWSASNVADIRLDRLSFFSTTYGQLRGKAERQIVCSSKATHRHGARWRELETMVLDEGREATRHDDDDNDEDERRRHAGEQAGGRWRRIATGGGELITIAGIHDGHAGRRTGNGQHLCNFEVQDRQVNRNTQSFVAHTQRAT